MAEDHGVDGWCSMYVVDQLIYIRNILLPTRDGELAVEHDLTLAMSTGEEEEGGGPERARHCLMISL